MIETGLPDFHKMVVMVMKTTYHKVEPKIVHYRDFKYFCNDSFKESLQQAMLQNTGDGCDEIYKNFATSCSKVLEKHIPTKTNVRGNHSPFMNN